MKRTLFVSTFLVNTFLVLGQKEIPIEYRNKFEKLSNLKWQEILYDCCTKDWHQHWFLDGKKARISHSERGMDFWSGPIRLEDASHAVLWTKQQFKGDIRLDFEYTKLDDKNEAVTILYLLATGKETDGYEKDIAKWANKRVVPAMRKYFDNMNVLHISYAAFNAGNDKKNDYIRARRYMPKLNNGLNNTALEPSYYRTGLFKKDVPYQVTVIKKGEELFMRIKGDKTEYLCHWNTDKFPPVKEGRIGLRHMWTRAARYYNFKISRLCNE